MTKIVNGTDGGRHVVAEPLTTTNTAQVAPGLLRNSIDQRIVRIRPASTPVDQLSRCVGSRHCSSMTVEYYSVDTKQPETTLSKAYDPSTKPRKRSDGVYTIALDVAHPEIFEATDTLMIPACLVGENASPLVGYVFEIRADGKVDIVPVNAPVDSTATDPAAPVVGAIAAGARVVRMGRAATELDVMTPQFQALPRKDSNYCQIFKMQVEQSTMQKIAAKEVDWNFSDQEEAAIIDMRLGMEKNFLFGARAKFFDVRKNEDVYLTGGIWTQTDKEFRFASAQITEKDLIDLCAKAFSGNNGSKKKILVAGTDLLTSLNKCEFTRAVSTNSDFTRWGIRFREIVSNFGTLYVVHSEIFDQCGHAGDGFVLDPDYITKYTHIPFSKERLDLRTSGVRNTDAVVLTEASCIVLRQPGAHLRVYGASK